MNKEDSLKLVTTKTIHQLDYSDFERIVNAVYGVGYSYVSSEELSNYTAQTYNEMGKNFDDIDEVEDEIADFKSGNHSWKAPILLQDLITQGYLPEGDYVIKICW